MLRTRLLILTVIAAAVVTVNGDIIPTFSSAPPTGSNFTWNYSTNVTVDQMVQHGDFFTIYDFGNFTSGSNLQPANWAFSSSLTGITPALVLPTDSGSLLNLTWTYTGTTAINGSSLLGIFSVVTDTNQLRASDFAAEATRSNGPNAGTKVDNIGRVSVPVPEFATFLPVLSVCGAALAASLPSYLRRRKRI